MTTEAALQDLTGLFQALSGIVYDNQKNIFAFPTKADFSSLSSTHSSRFNTIESSITEIQDSVNDLIGFVQNLKLQQSQTATDFADYTGLKPNLEEIADEVSGTITVSVGDLVPVNVTSSAVTINPPASPSQGDTFAIVDSRGNAATNLITVDFVNASQLLFGTSENYELNADGGFARFRYINSTIGWIVEL